MEFDPGWIARRPSSDGSARCGATDGRGAWLRGRGWAYIREHFPDVEFLVLLNVDTIADARWLQAMVKHLRQNRCVITAINIPSFNLYDSRTLNDF